MSEIIKAILRRRSVRVFKPFEVSHEDIEKLVKAACYAPAGGNESKWEVIVVQDDSMKSKLTEVSLNQEFIKYSSVVFVFLGGRTVNVAAAIQNLLLAAHSLGLEGCWIGAFDREKVAKLLNIPLGTPVHAIVAIGKPEEVPTDPGKRFPEEVLHFERYGRKRVNLSLLGKVVSQAKEKLSEYKDLRATVKEEYGEESFYMYRIEEKYAAFVFRPLLRRILRIIEELGICEDLSNKLRETIREYERGRGERLSATLDINSKEVTEWERKYANEVFLKLIEEVAKTYSQMR